MNAKNSQLAPNTLKDIRVLVVDDEEILAWSIDTELRALGAEITKASSVREAIERFPAASPDLVITDLKLPDGNGLELLKKWRFEYPDLPIILITAHGAIDSAVTALRLGAFDYLQKPFNMKDLIAAVKRASEVAKLRQKVSSMTAAESPSTEVDIVGDAPAMLRLKDQLRRIARSKANTALLLGDSGTGKELAARAIHEWSDRRAQPFVEINCASIPDTLLESELFGYEKGAFTDARERKLGLFEIARNGTVFLDEIGEMPLKLQSKLLRALEYRRFKRLGGTKDIEFTGRIVAATNRDLPREVGEGRFRGDLYFRLNVLPVSLPLLRERLEDLPRLCSFMVKKLADELGMAVPSVAADAMATLQQHSWPGNVRELKNVLQRAMVFHEPAVIHREHLAIDAWPSFDGEPRTAPAIVGMTERPPPASANFHAIPVTTASFPVAPVVPVAAPQTAYVPPLLAPAPVQPASSPFTLPSEGINLESLEKSLLVQALDKAHHNQTRAAQLLGISRHTLRYRLEKYGLAIAE